MRKIKQLFNIKFLFLIFCLPVGILLVSSAFADVDELRPMNLTNGSYTNDNQPEFEFDLSNDEGQFPLIYLVDVTSTYSEWEEGEGGRVIRYHYEIEEESADDLDTPFTFKVGQPAGDGMYLTGSENQDLVDGPYWWKVGTSDEVEPGDDDFEWMEAGDEETPAFIVDTTGPDFNEPPVSTSHNEEQWSNSNSISFTWAPATDPAAGGEPGSGLAGYYYVVDSSFDTAPDDGDEALGDDAQDVTINNVTNGNDIWFHIAAVDELGNLGSSEHIGPFYIDTTRPSQPGQPSSDTGSPTSVTNPTISWEGSIDLNSGISRYIVEWSDNEEFSDAQSDFTVDDDPTFTVSPPLSEGVWYFKVKAVDNAGNESEDYSQVGLVVIDTSGPALEEETFESNPEVSVWSNIDEVIITWSPAVDPDVDSEEGSGLQGYYYLWNNTSNSEPNSENHSGTTLGSEATSIHFEDLGDNAAYYFHLRAYDNLGQLGNTVHIGPFRIDSTKPSKPGTPSAAGATQVNSNDVQITWNVSNFDISGADSPAYTIEYALEDEELDNPNTVTSDINSYDFSDLDDGTWYFRVTAHDAAGNNSDPSDIGSVTVDTQGPGIIAESISANASNTSVVITWDTTEDANSLVRYGITDSYTESESNLSSYVTNHNIEISGLLECTTYFYMIESEDELENGDSSDGHSFTTSGCVGDSQVLNQTQAEITSQDGGNVSLLDERGGIELNVPENYSNQNAIFQIKQLNVSSVASEIGVPDDNSWIGAYAYDLKALTETDSTIDEFDELIEIIIYFTEEDVNGIDISSLRIWQWHENEWKELENCVVNIGEYSVTCQTSYFSVFGLFGESSEEPKPAATHADFSPPAAPSCTDQKPSSTPDLFQIDVSNTQAILYFAPVGDANYYFIAYGEGENTEVHGVQFDSGLSTGVLAYTINLLQPNTTYSFKVRGGNGCMPGEWSNTMQVKTRNTSSGGTTYYKNLLTRILSIFPKQISDAGATPTSTNQQPAGSGMYTVQSGDSLWNISLSQCGTATKYTNIMQENGLSSSLIHPGLVLKISC